MIWKQLLESFLLQPDGRHLKTEHQIHLACLSINFSPEILEHDLLKTLSIQFIAKAHLVEHLPQSYRPTADNTGICFLYLDPQTALQAALLVDSTLSKLRLHSTISLGYGEGVQLEDEWKSIELFRSKRLI